MTNQGPSLLFPSLLDEENPLFSLQCISHKHSIHQSLRWLRMSLDLNFSEGSVGPRSKRSPKSIVLVHPFNLPMALLQRRSYHTRFRSQLLHLLRITCGTHSIVRKSPIRPFQLTVCAQKLRAILIPAPSQDFLD
ncbi:hypothetical protein I314_03624 [Cryptococcus bacillisporus CA1873]|uniref:Uncharacterized protein n=1 Tax=Cryptococcus bacillisporus CA1873 TaxID=1296111 RepID=A0ABR5B9X2_CRYGA|nr:hypothetical protein I314_03624 [Cryptococcus bacillisporus CA1873]|eukprot:KIR60333.1 hypothetical protein I314_03624 [Cryptococcus gattii CA1873]